MDKLRLMKDPKNSEILIGGKYRIIRKIGKWMAGVAWGKVFKVLGVEMSLVEVISRPRLASGWQIAGERHWRPAVHGLGNVGKFSRNVLKRLDRI